MGENSIGGIIKYFERILRWLYPGLLLWLLFLAIGEHTFFKEVLEVSIWAFLLLLFTLGAVIYLIQSGILTQFISYFTLWPDWDIAANENDDPDAVCKQPRPIPRWRCCNWFAVKVFDKHAGEIERKIFRDKSYSIMDYQWGVYHVLSITGWLTIVVVSTFGNNSALDRWFVYLLGVLFLLASFGQYARLCRVRR